MANHADHPYNTVGNTGVWCILIFRFLIGLRLVYW